MPRKFQIGPISPTVCIAIGIPLLNLIRQLAYSGGPAFASSDEGGYLSWARIISGHQSAIGSAVYPGYSILLSPIYFVTTSPSLVWHGVLGINTLLCVGILLQSDILHRSWNPATSTQERLVLVGAIGLYPLLTTMAGYAFPSLATSFFLLLAVNSFRSALSNPLGIYKCAISVLALVLLHPTNIGFVFALLIAVLGWIPLKRWILALCSIFIGIASLVILSQLQSSLRSNLLGTTASEVLGYDIRNRLIDSRLLDFNSIHSGMVHLSVLCLSIIVSTFGLPLRLFVRAETASSPSTNAKTGRAPTLLIVFVGLGFYVAATIREFGLGGLDSLASFQIDNWLFQRYLEPIIPILITLGIATRSGSSRRSRLPVVISAFVITLAGCLALNWLFHQKLMLSGPQETNDYLLPMVNGFWPQYLNVNITVWIACSLAVPFLLLAKNRNVVPLALAAFSLISLPVQKDWYERFSQTFARPTDLVKVIEQTTKPRQCVGFDVLPESVDEDQIRRDASSGGEEFVQKKLQEAEAISSSRSGIAFGTNAFWLSRFRFQQMSRSEWANTCDGPFLTWRPNFESDIVVAKDTFIGLYLISKNQNFVSDYSSYPYNLTFYTQKQDPCLVSRCFGEAANSMVLLGGARLISDDKAVLIGANGQGATSKGDILNAGNYRIFVDGTSLSTGLLKVSLTEDGGRTSISSSVIPLNPKVNSYPIEFHLDRWVSDLQISIETSSAEGFRLQGFRIVSS